MAQMEFSRAGLVQVLLDGRDERRARLEVVAFATQREYKPFASKHGAEAFLEHRRGKELIVLGPLKEYLQAAHVSHELAHYLLYMRIPLQPSWFREGMAEFSSSPLRASSRSYVAGLPSPWNLRIVNNSRVPVRDLLAWRGDESYRVEYYPWSCLLVHYLINRHPDALREFETRLANFEDPTDAWNAAFPVWSLTASGRTEVLDEELDAYKRSPEQRPQVFRVSASANVSERPLSRAEAITTRLRLERRWAPGELESELERALVLDPANVQALTMKAERAPAGAAKLAQRAVAAHPDDPAAWVLRARWPGIVGREVMKQSVASFRKALKLAPHDPNIALDLASLLLDVGNPQEALPLALQAQRAEPWKPVAFFIGALARADVGQCDEADVDATRYARLFAVDGKQSPPGPKQIVAERLRVCRTPTTREADAVQRRAQDAVRERDFSTAVMLFEEVIAKDPLRASAWAQLGAVYTGMKRHAEAIRTLRHLAEFAPDNTQVWGLLGAALEASGDRAEAEKAFRRHVQVDPEDWKSRRTLAQFLMRQGRAAEAAPEFEKAPQLAPPKGSVERDREE
jgi:cytochrome c-type biogenesis protein CcmH/NrfG